MNQLSLFHIEEQSGRVIVCDDSLYVKLLSNPRFTNNRWEALAQVNESLCVIEVKITEYNWKPKPFIV